MYASIFTPRLLHFRFDKAEGAVQVRFKACRFNLSQAIILNTEAGHSKVHVYEVTAQAAASNVTVCTP